VEARRNVPNGNRGAPQLWRPSLDWGGNNNRRHGRGESQQVRNGTSGFLVFCCVPRTGQDNNNESSLQFHPNPIEDAFVYTPGARLAWRYSNSSVRPSVCLVSHLLQTVMWLIDFGWLGANAKLLKGPNKTHANSQGQPRRDDSSIPHVWMIHLPSASAELALVFSQPTQPLYSRNRNLGASLTRVPVPRTMSFFVSLLNERQKKNYFIFHGLFLYERWSAARLRKLAVTVRLWNGRSIKRPPLRRRRHENLRPCYSG